MIKFSYSTQNTLTWSVSSAYQKTVHNAPRHFVFYQGHILIEHRDVLAHDTDEFGQWINCEWGDLKYKLATLEPHPTSTTFNNNKPFNPSYLQITYNKKSTLIEDGKKFWIENGEVIQEPFEHPELINLTELPRNGWYH